MTDTTREWEREPVTPLTVISYVPAGVDGVVERVITVECVVVEETVTVVDAKDTVGPSGYTVAVRLTGPKKPERPDRDTVYLPDAPAVSVREVGLLVITKSLTVTTTVNERDDVPTVPVTVMA